MLPVKLPENINLNVKGNPLDQKKKIGKKLKLMEKNYKRNRYFRYICLFFLVFFKILFTKKKRLWF